MSSQLDRALVVLRDRFGYPAFRSGQERAVTSVLAGRDTLVVLPTGGGKSLCYQVPALVLPKLTVVISPLISLMKDQVDALNRRGLPATFINSTLSSGEASDRMRRAVTGEVKMLYLAPERFDTGSTAERLREGGVSMLAVDEAHCISQWGHDFRPSYLRVASIRERLGWPPTIALTATATPHVRSDITRHLKLVNPEVIITGFDRTNLSYFVVPATTEDAKDRALAGILRQRAGLAVVYASTRKAVERIAGALSMAGVPSIAYHAGLDDERRHEVQNAFMHEKVRTIVATNAFGMGIDKPNVRLVVHHAMPGTLEAYYQEAGRAGRDGLPGECFLLHAFPDRFTHEYFIKGSHPERVLVEAVYKALTAVAAHDGTIVIDLPRIARAVSATTSAREVESALRLLTTAGAFIDDRRAGPRACVRLLATPERIRRELGPDESLELGLMRTLWRGGRGALGTGVAFDLDALPPGFGGCYGAQRLLNALQDRQFIHWTATSPGTRLAAPRRPLASFAIDWDAIARRRSADLSKLDAMQRYAYLKTCRRGFVLRYFGDSAARARCSGCDNCLGIRLDVASLAPAAEGTRRPVRGAIFQR
jgi:ATP-dependent DNA helicase RecQ